ncbi:Alpha/Beta hydrolase protein [Nemania abortiva]|nr:Alpha/Beta hydrolase protein [Nemania abortiva]
MSTTKMPVPVIESSIKTVRPPYDPFLQPALEASSAQLPEMLDLQTLRSISNNFGPDGVLKSYPDMDHNEQTIPGLQDGDDEVILSIFRPKAPSNSRFPTLYYVHGGGQVSGNRFTATDKIMDYFGEVKIVCVSVEYRLAPEHPAPAGVYDSYAGLVWAVDHAAELGIDAAKIFVVGGSGGAPIALGTSMLCRNNQKPYPLAQMILTPMLDDRDNTVSAEQFARDGPWCGTTNRMAWDHVLGSKRGRPDVSGLEAPAREMDLAGLPPTFVDAGECEVFRDEAVAFASQLWKCGVSAELHVWPGAYHGFDILTADAPISRESRAAKANWIKRILGINLSRS